MSASPYIALAVSCFAKVFLAGLQLKHVQHSRYGWIILTSMLMSLADAWMIRSIAKLDDFLSLAVVMVANSLGIWLAVYLHDRKFSKVPAVPTVTPLSTTP